MMLKNADRLSSREWACTLMGLAIVLVCGVLIEATPRGNYLQLSIIFVSAIGMASFLMILVRFLSRKATPASVSLKPEVKNHGFARV